MLMAYLFHSFIRLLQSVLDVLKKMLLQSSPNPVAHTVEKQAGWSLLSSLLASMPKEVEYIPFVFDSLLAASIIDF